MQIKTSYSAIERGRHHYVTCSGEQDALYRSGMLRESDEAKTTASVPNLDLKKQDLQQTTLNLLLFSSIRWESLSTLLLPSGLSLSPFASQSFLNTSFYRAYSSFSSLTPLSFASRPVSALYDLLWIKFCSFLGPFQTNITNPGRDLGRFLLQ